MKSEGKIYETLLLLHVHILNTKSGKLRNRSWGKSITITLNLTVIL
jgi:hypothetical protein